MSEEKRNSFQILNDINLKNKVKEKIGLSYLSWADAWAELKKNYPEAYWKVYHREITTTETKVTTEQDGVQTTVTNTYTNEVPYFTDGKTCFVKVGVVIGDHEEVEELPVMNNKNNAISATMVTMTDVNKAIQRAFVKACARHGLGLYVYSGEDLPEAERKVIDFKAIGDNCDRFQTVALTEDAFKKMQSDVIADVQDSYPEDASKAIIEYVSKTANGKKLSLFTLAEDNVQLQRIYNFINEVKKQLAAPNGK